MLESATFEQTRSHSKRNYRFETSCYIVRTFSQPISILFWVCQGEDSYLSFLLILYSLGWIDWLRIGQMFAARFMRTTSLVLCLPLLGFYLDCWYYKYLITEVFLWLKKLYDKLLKILWMFFFLSLLDLSFLAYIEYL